MPSAWIQHIRDFAKANNKSYGCALSDPECSRTYRLKHPLKTKGASKKKTATPVPPPPLVAAEPTGNPKLQMKGIEIKRPASEFDFKEIEPPKPVKAKRIIKKGPPSEQELLLKEKGFKPPKKKIEFIIEEEEEPPSRTKTLDTLIQMVADDSPDLPADIKKIKKLYDIRAELNYYYSKPRGHIDVRRKEIDDINKKLFTDYKIEKETYVFLESIESWRYTEPIDKLEAKFKERKEIALKERDLPHIPYLLGIIKYILDFMKNVSTGTKTIGVYLDKTYGTEPAYNIRNGVIRIPEVIPETAKQRKKESRTLYEGMMAKRRVVKGAEDKIASYELKLKDAKTEKDKASYQAKIDALTPKVTKYQNLLNKMKKANMFINNDWLL